MPPKTVSLLVGVWALSAVFIGVIAFDGWPFTESAIAIERSPMTWLSSVILVLSAWVAALIWTRPKTSALWLVVAMGLLVAALDERFMLHEEIKLWLVYHLFDSEPESLSLLANATLLLYLAGAGALAVFLRSQPVPGVGVIVVLVAIVLGGVTVGIDVLELGGFWLIARELAESAAELCILSSVLVAERSCWW